MNEQNWTTAEVVSLLNATIITKEEARTLLGIDKPIEPSAVSQANPTPAPETPVPTPEPTG